jgi:hypothetical protein
MGPLRPSDPREVAAAYSSIVDITLTLSCFTSGYSHEIEPMYTNLLTCVTLLGSKTWVKRRDDAKGSSQIAKFNVDKSLCQAAIAWTFALISAVLATAWTTPDWSNFQRS